MSSTVVGGAGLLEGVADLHSRSPWLADLALSGTSVLLGGPTKNVLKRAGGEAADQIIDRGASAFGNFVGNAVTKISAEKGITLTVTIGGLTGTAEAADLGGAANILSSTVISILAGVGSGKVASKVDDLRATWRKAKRLDRILNAGPPNATDPRLKNAFGELFRTSDTRPGGTAGELLREIASGDLIERNGILQPRHLQKADGFVKNLGETLSDRVNPLSRSDRNAAERVRQDLLFAIQQFEPK